MAQLSRSAVSIGANIAEGCGKSSRAETIRYLDIAAASAAETEHHLILAADAAVFESGQVEDLLARIGSIRRRMLQSLQRKLPAS